MAAEGFSDLSRRTANAGKTNCGYVAKRTSRRAVVVNPTNSDRPSSATAGCDLSRKVRSIRPAGPSGNRDESISHRESDLSEAAQDLGCHTERDRRGFRFGIEFALDPARFLSAFYRVVSSQRRARENSVHGARVCERTDDQGGSFRRTTTGDCEAAMIICSCNALSDHDVHKALAGVSGEALSAECLHRCLGCRVKCGRCVTTIRRILGAASRNQSQTNWYEMQLP